MYNDSPRGVPAGIPVFQQKKTLNAGGRIIDLSVPKVMGILNLTPDSFYDGGRNNHTIDALVKAEQMLGEGAHFIDIGAYSSRPKAEDIPVKEELRRLLPVLKLIVNRFPDAVISVDTFRSEVAAAAIGEGAAIINDISAGNLDEKMFETIAALKVPYIMMHMKGTPQNMLQQAHYDDVFAEVFNYFLQKIARLAGMGVYDLVIDPGFGFAKTSEHSYQLLSKLNQLGILGLPVLAGISRKSMLCKPLGITAAEALNVTTAANTIALMKGADILRVHDVKEAVEAIKITELTKGLT